MVRMSSFLCIEPMLSCRNSQNKSGQKTLSVQWKGNQIFIMTRFHLPFGDWHHGCPPEPGPGTRICDTNTQTGTAKRKGPVT